MAPKNKRKRVSEVPPEPVGALYTPSETPGSEVAAAKVVFDMSPFKVEWVNSANPPAKKAKKSKKDVSEVKQEEGITDSGLGGLYTVSPGGFWNDLRKYRNFVVNPHNDPKDDAKHKFEVGQHIFVNHSETPDAIVSSDKESWVAQVKEVRAEGQHAVYIRVLWFYWPDELPSGREPYHGERELIASNYHQIIDAMTVSGKANVHYLKDVHDMSSIPADNLYWRQTLDTCKKPLRPSSLPKDCVCKTPTNPDMTVVRCLYEECGKWQHEKCLVDAILTRYWDERGDKLEKTSKELRTNVKEGGSGEESDIGDTIEASPRRGLLGFGRQVIASLTGSSSSSGSQKKKLSKASKQNKKSRRNSKLGALVDSEQPWTGKLTAKLQFNQSPDQGKEFNGKATIYRISKSQGTEILEDFDEMEVNCLFCKQSFVEEVEETPAEFQGGDLDPSLFVSQDQSVVSLPDEQKLLATRQPTTKYSSVNKTTYDAVREAAASHASNGEGEATSGSE